MRCNVYYIFAVYSQICCPPQLKLRTDLRIKSSVTLYKIYSIINPTIRAHVMFRFKHVVFNHASIPSPNLLLINITTLLRGIVVVLVLCTPKLTFPTHTPPRKHGTYTNC